MSSTVSRHVSTIVTILGINFALLVIGAPDASAQSDFTHLMDFPYTPNNCSAEPAYDRVFRLQRVTWKGHEYLFVDEGNDIHIYNIDDPFNPVGGYASYFGIDPQGDFDYNLVNFSVCDDCRWGVGEHKTGTILFDLGTGDTPSISAHAYYGDTFIEGGFTFSHDGQQYLVAADLGANPCPSNTSGLYEFNSLDETSNPLLHCLDNGGTGPEISNGLVIPDSPTPTLYLAERFGQLRIYSMQTTPTFGLVYEGNGGIDRIRMNRCYSAGVDADAGLIVVARQATSSAPPAIMDIYDIGWANGTPTAPVLLNSEEIPGQPVVGTVGFRYPILWAAVPNTPSSPVTFDLSDPMAMVPLDQSFWDTSQPWNSLSTCLYNEMATFSGDGSVMYLSRYAALQVIDVSGIQPPQCGNGLIEVLEDCDDGNTGDGDGCSVDCVVDSGWICSSEPSVCVQLTSCGDGLLQAPELCDDGNTTAGDGCSASCQTESGWVCENEPSVCVTTPPCGDGVIGVGEECDDGNQSAADGCSHLCEVESGWSCEGQPSLCSQQDSSTEKGSDGCGCAHSGGAQLPLTAAVFGLLLWLLGGVRRWSGR